MSHDPRYDILFEPMCIGPVQTPPISGHSLLEKSDLLMLRSELL